MMVRKPVNQNTNQPAAHPAPYPITPTSPTQQRAQIVTPSTQRHGGDSDPPRRQTLETSDDLNPWRSDDDDALQGEEQRAKDSQLPPLLRVGGERLQAEVKRNEGIPPLLQVGSSKDTPRSSLESQRSTDAAAVASNAPVELHIQSTTETSPTYRPGNPYHRLHNTNDEPLEKAGSGAESSADIWGGDQNAPALPQVQAPSRQLFTEPWMNFEKSHARSNVPQHIDPTDSSRVRRPSSPFSDQTTGVVDIEDTEIPMLDGQSPRRKSRPQPQDPLNYDAIYSTNSLNRASLPVHQSLVNSHIDSPDHTNKDPLYHPFVDDVGPPLPPRTSQEKEEPPPQPPRPPKTSSAQTEDASNPQSQQGESAKAKRARETYQIRHVNWYDASSPTNPRRSPIMVQNANGPCPLLALVNALVLSTPVDYATALVETLRVREQVSLGLLLDAVIDELIGRNGDLADVSDMYAFLVNLHTGMNVNPQFVPLETPINLMDAPIEGDLPTNLSDTRKAGGFEDTREMKLYGNFKIPLIHGWIPPKNHPATAALKRTARNYEDAQNLMFREEELEEKLRQNGLSSEEQVVLEDIASIKYFLSSTATQLTGYGLDIITETMAPGSIAILFRNDHFSTLYKHPKSGQLLTLVTDMGYAGHDEVVWESLVDVSGEGCEFFSGDFRPVGNNAGDSHAQPQPQPQDEEEGWTTVSHKPRSRRSDPPPHQPTHTSLPPLSTLPIDEPETPLSPTREEQDHDLALALQLQEEEEERERQAAASRRREDELSQAYLNSSDASGRRTFPGFSTGATAARNGPNPPPRGGRGRGNGNATRSGRSAPSPGGRQPPPPARRSVDTSDEPPPPTYEQAAKGPAYHPPAHHPAHPHASSSPNPNTSRPLPARPSPHTQTSAYSEHASSYHTSSPPYAQQPRRGYRDVSGRGGVRGAAAAGGVDPGMIRRRTGGSVESEDERAGKEREKEKDCVVM